MSKFNKKQLFTGLGVAAVVGISAVGISASAHPNFFSNEAVRTSIQSGNLEEFKQAVEDSGQQRLSNYVDSIDEEKFAQIQERFAIKEAVDEAITNNDYEAFLAATEGVESGKFDDFTEEQFNQLVTRRAEMETFREEITLAVEASDQEQFNNLVRERFESFSNDSQGRGARGDFELTDEKLEEMYSRAQQQLEDGQEINLKFGGGRRKGFGMRRN